MQQSDEVTETLTASASASPGCLRLYGDTTCTEIQLVRRYNLYGDTTQCKACTEIQLCLYRDTTRYNSQHQKGRNSIKQHRTIQVRDNDLNKDTSAIHSTGTQREVFFCTGRQEKHQMVLLHLLQHIEIMSRVRTAQHDPHRNSQIFYVHICTLHLVKPYHHRRLYDVIPCRLQSRSTLCSAMCTLLT